VTKTIKTIKTDKLAKIEFTLVMVLTVVLGLTIVETFKIMAVTQEVVYKVLQ
jgi:hypothetical protein